MLICQLPDLLNASATENPIPLAMVYTVSMHLFISKVPWLHLLPPVINATRLIFFLILNLKKSKIKARDTVIGIL
jgi:hypothetical protein